MKHCSNLIEKKNFFDCFPLLFPNPNARIISFYILKSCFPKGTTHDPAFIENRTFKQNIKMSLSNVFVNHWDFFLMVDLWLSDALIVQTCRG